MSLVERNAEVDSAITEIDINMTEKIQELKKSVELKKQWILCGSAVVLS